MQVDECHILINLGNNLNDILHRFGATEHVKLRKSSTTLNLLEELGRPTRASIIEKKAGQEGRTHC